MNNQTLRTTGLWAFRHFAIVLAAVFLFCAPNVDFVTHITWHDQQRSLQIVVLAAILFYLAFGRSRLLFGLQQTLCHGRRILVAAALFFLLGAISAAKAYLPEWAFLEWGLLLALMIFSAQIAADINASNPESAGRFLLWSLFAMATAYCVKSLMLYAVMVLVGLNLHMPFDVYELFSGFSNPRFFGQFAVMVTPFLVLPALFWGRSRSQRLAMGCVPAVWWMLIIASGSRGTWIALMAGAVLVFFHARSVALHWLRWQGTCALVGAGIYLMLFIVGPTILTSKFNAVLPLDRHQGWASLSFRDKLWGQSLQMIADHPWWGVGPMHFSWYPNGIGAHPHNAILQIIVEWGIPAALLLSVVLSLGAIAWWRHVGTVTNRQPGSPRTTICFALLAALSGAAALSLVDGVIVMPVSQMTLVLMCGWAWGLALSGDPGPRTLQDSKASWGIRLIACAAIFAIAQGVYPVAGKLSEREEAYLEAHPGSVLFPRFWVQGWIRD